MKHVLCLFVFCLFYSTYAQRGLFNQRYLEMAKDFDINENQLDNYKSEGDLVIYNEEKHKTRFANKLLNARIGKTKKIDKGFYKMENKVLDKQEITHYRVRYIFIDKTKFQTDRDFQNYLDKIRNLLDQTTFKSVAMQYSMDYKKNVGGDSGWFKKGKTHPIFFREATNKAKLADEVFEFEIPEINAYYLVKKTNTQMNISEVLVLQTKKKK